MDNKNNFRLDNKIVIITGCSGDIGKCISEIFIDYGAKVYGFARRKLKTDSFVYSQNGPENPKKFEEEIKKIYLKEKKISGVITANLFNFLGDGLKVARNFAIRNNVPLAKF